MIWRGFGEGGNIPAHSIPRQVEEQADTLRSRYLAWIYDLGEAQIKGKRLVDHLELRPGFSYWWMTLLTEKCNYGKSPQIYDAVKLLVLEDMIVTHSVGQLILVSDDKTLAHVFRLWCCNAGLAFEWRKLNGRTSSVSLMRRLNRLLPHPVQALVSLLRYCQQRWPLRRAGAAQLAKSAAKITFCSYFDNLDMEAARQDHFYSRYWTALPEALAQGGFRTNWLQLYFQDESVPTAQQARDLITRFNQGGVGTQSHTTLDGALGWSVIRGTLRDYGRIVLMGVRLRKARRHFRPAGSNVDFWPLFEQDWRRSLFGATAMSNCIFLNLFERTLKNLPRQKLGVYLHENQGWEKAFLHTWKAAGHGCLVGVPHSTVRYWDLRYFFDPRSYQRTGKNDLPLPDVVALNGPAAMAAYRKGGYPENKIVEVEALRYLYLADAPKKSIEATTVERPGPLQVLILTDYLPSITRAQMQMLVKAASLLPMETQYIVKAHPNCPVSVSDYLPVNLHLSRGASIANLLGECDVVYTSSTTSAAVDAYCMGVPVLSMLDGSAFNMSPLRGVLGVVFVSSPAELARELLKSHRHIDSAENHEYFTINPGMPRWKSLFRTLPDA